MCPLVGKRPIPGQPVSLEQAQYAYPSPHESAITPKQIHEECLCICRPCRYDGNREAREADEIVTSPELYFRPQNAPKEPKLLLLSSVLEKEARHIWLCLGTRTAFPEHAWSRKGCLDTLG